MKNYNWYQNVFICPDQYQAFYEKTFLENYIPVKIRFRKFT
jgi:hypothetical protein